MHGHVLTASDLAHASRVFYRADARWRHHCIDAVNDASGGVSPLDFDSGECNCVSCEGSGSAAVLSLYNLQLRSVSVKLLADLNLWKWNVVFSRSLALYVRSLPAWWRLPSLLCIWLRGFWIKERKSWGGRRQTSSDEALAVAIRRPGRRFTVHCAFTL